jgi:hypothetical protein
MELSRQGCKEEQDDEDGGCDLHVSGRASGGEDDF